MSKPQTIFYGMLSGTFWTGASKILGFLKHAWFAALFGLSAQMDSYLFSMNIVSLVIMLAGQWLASMAGIYLVKTRTQHGMETCLSKAAALAWLGLGLGLCMGAAIWLTAPMLSQLAVGFDEAQRQAVAHGLLLLLPLVVLGPVHGVLQSTLTATRRFTIVYHADFVGAVVALFIIWRWADHPYVLCLSMSANMLACTLWILLWTAPQLAMRRPSMSGTFTFFRQYRLLLLHPWSSALNMALASVLLSYLPTGGMSALYFASIIATVAGGMVDPMPGFQTAVNEYPKTATHAVSKRLEDLVALVILYNLPIAIFCAFFGAAVVSLVLGYGEFGDTSEKIVGTILAMQLMLLTLNRVVAGLGTILYAKAKLLPTLVGPFFRLCIDLPSRALFVLGLSWGPHGILAGTFISEPAYAAFLAMHVRRLEVRVVVKAHLRWMAWVSACSVAVAMPLWLAMQAWTWPAAAILPVGAMYLVGVALLVRRYRGPERALLTHYTQRLASAAQALRARWR